jgi:inosine/xanthosine triphosphatase
MKVSIGSKNQVKVEALKELLSDYEMFKGAEIASIEVSTEVDEQPKSVEETLKGAMNRAKNAFIDASYSFGIESGLMKIPFTKTGYMDFTACAIYDGKEFHIGLSSAFEYPKEITRLVLEEGVTISDAAHKIGITTNPKIGAHEGVIGILTRGKLVRKEYTKEAIRMALIHLENAHLY